MSSTSSAGKPMIIPPSSNTADPVQLDWIDWLYDAFPGGHTHEEIREFYVSKYGSIEAAKLVIDGLRQLMRSVPKPLKQLGVRSDQSLHSALSRPGRGATHCRHQR